MPIHLVDRAINELERRKADKEKEKRRANQREANTQYYEYDFVSGTPALFGLRNPTPTPPPPPPAPPLPSPVSFSDMDVDTLLGQTTEAE